MGVYDDPLGAFLFADLRQRLVLLPPIVCLVMMVLTNNLITAFGMMAVFAIVRFRNILRDTLDTTYILISLVIGMAAGTQKFASAVWGAPWSR